MEIMPMAAADRLTFAVPPSSVRVQSVDVGAIHRSRRTRVFFQHLLSNILHDSENQCHHQCSKITVEDRAIMQYNCDRKVNHNQAMNSRPNGIHRPVDSLSRGTGDEYCLYYIVYNGFSFNVQKWLYLEVEGEKIDGNREFPSVVLHDARQEGLREVEPGNPEHRRLALLKPFLHTCFSIIPRLMASRTNAN